MKYTRTPLRHDAALALADTLLQQIDDYEHERCPLCGGDGGCDPDWGDGFGCPVAVYRSARDMSAEKSPPMPSPKKRPARIKESTR